MGVPTCCANIEHRINREMFEALELQFVYTKNRSHTVGEVLQGGFLGLGPRETSYFLIVFRRLFSFRSWTYRKKPADKPLAPEIQH